MPAFARTRGLGTLHCICYGCAHPPRKPYGTPHFMEGMIAAFNVNSIRGQVARLPIQFSLFPLSHPARPRGPHVV